jgi:hypothetical protein
MILIRSTDCTRPHRSRPRARARGLLSAWAALVLALSFALLPRAARADGDPASDVLATQALFLPQDAGLPAGQQQQLAALLDRAARGGYPIRVALVASAADLGSVGELWRAPQSYARYLGAELSLVYRGPLLVVMPNGYSVYRATGVRAAEQSALATLSPPGADLGGATIGAIRRLAAAEGRNLPLPSPTALANPSRTDAVAWLVFAIGAAVIATAWTLSLRARSPRRHELDGTTS